MKAEFYIEFVKNHEVGISKGEIKKVNKSIKEKFINEGYAKDSNQKDFDLLMYGKVQEEKEQVKEAKEEEKKEALKKAKTANQKEIDAQYKAIDELDLESNPKLVEQGLKSGDKVLRDKDGLIKFDKKGNAKLQK